MKWTWASGDTMTHTFSPAVSFNPLHPNISMYFLHSLLLTFFQGSDKENLIKNKEPPRLAIISFTLMILTNDSGVLQHGEIRYWSLWV